MNTSTDSMRSGAPAGLSWHEEGEGVCIDGCGWAESIEIPASVGGLPVLRVRLGPDSLTADCRRLSLAEGIAEAALDFGNARGLRELDFPASARLCASPIDIQLTAWFKSRSGPVYLGGCYCGTPGGGAGGQGELVIAEGTLSVARGADFHCGWRRIVIPDSVQSIGACAFADAFCLEELRLPGGELSLGSHAFASCPRLQELSLPEGSGLEASFPRCPRLRLRSGPGERLLLREGGAPLRGRLSAYPIPGPLAIFGREYPDERSFDLFEDPNGCLHDRYGFLCRSFRLQSPAVPRLGEEDLWYLGLPDGRCLPLRLGSFRRSGERERLEELRLWYICGPEGLSEVVRDPIRGVYLVSEGLGAGDLEPALLGLLGPGMLEPLDLPF